MSDDGLKAFTEYFKILDTTLDLVTVYHHSNVLNRYLSKCF